MKRDLNADLAICNAATAGHWTVDDHVDYANIRVGRAVVAETSSKDARFIAEARTGWPAAIERALAAEAEVERLHGIIREARDIYARGLFSYRIDEKLREATE